MVLSSISGGQFNNVLSQYSSVNSGMYNGVSANYSFIGGGASNTIAGLYAVVGAVHQIHHQEIMLSPSGKN